ncbi:hypothetical protein FRC04_011615 [Tulasnella sp. 424]|nr:hypothetical protein FRC04_011615 [Tulasnella sp. 424]KAG8967197.1 hypothetical protein FRC05_002272 [Tulasnella sp. 425]
MSDYASERLQLQRVLKSPHAQMIVSLNPVGLSAYKPEDTHPRSAPKVTQEHLPPIHRIPYETLLYIIDIYTQDSACPVQDLSGLTLVCKRWHAIVEDASFLWGRIDASEGLALVRKGLRMAKGAALYITYIQRQSKTDESAFFKAIGARSDQWRSLVVNARQGKHCAAILETTISPRLEKLHLSGDPSLWGRSDDEPLILFGGAAAPPSLKDVHLEDIPIAMTPLKLACLRSLHLGEIYNLSISELLRILSDSPALETLTLASTEEDLVPDTAPNLPPDWTIQLPSLSRLFLIYLSDALAHFFLSALTAPHLQKLHVECYWEGIPSVQLLNDDLVRLVPTLISLISTASEIQVTITGESGYKILAGGLEIAMDIFNARGHIHFQNNFEWLSNHLGGHLRNLPIHLRMNNSNSNIAYLEWFTTSAVVTKLTISSNFVWNHNPDRIISLLSNPIPSSPTSWYLPDLEILVAHLDRASGSFDIVQMIERRHTTDGVQGEGGLGVPKRFTEIHLSLRTRSSSPNVEFLKAVEAAGEGAEVFWEGKKWTGTGLEE